MDHKKGLTLAQLAKLAYSTDIFMVTAEARKIDSKFSCYLTKVGAFNHFYKFVTNDSINIIFPGTRSPTSKEGIDDALLDAACVMVPCDVWFPTIKFAFKTAKYRMHFGFLHRADTVYPQVLSSILSEENYDKKAVYVCGHSLGGAVAGIVGWALAESLRPNTVVTFGSPKIGNEAFSRTLTNRMDVIRYINSGDIITQLPVRSMTGLLFSSYGQRVDIGDPNTWPSMSIEAMAKADIVSGIRHSIDLYIANIQTLINGGTYV